MLHSIPFEPAHTSFNDLGYTVCQGNPHQPYPIRALVLTQTESIHHYTERYNNLFLKDQIWAGKKHWEKWHKFIEMLPFCEGLVSRGLQEWHDQEDQLPGCVNTSVRFAVVLSCELFEMVDKVSEETTTFDLLVGLSLMCVASSD